MCPPGWSPIKIYASGWTQPMNGFVSAPALNSATGFPKRVGSVPPIWDLEASRIAMGRAGWEPDDIDLIIFATLSPDLFFPGSGCLLAHKLGLTSTPALDIRQQCTGFLYGMATADAYIRSSLAKRVLLVGAEVHSTGLDISTRGRDVAVIFGDGAAAVCLERMETDVDGRHSCHPACMPTVRWPKA